MGYDVSSASTPTLAEVLAEGNDAGGTDIVGTNLVLVASTVGGQGSALVLQGGTGTGANDGGAASIVGGATTGSGISGVAVLRSGAAVDGDCDEARVHGGTSANGLGGAAVLQPGYGGSANGSAYIKSAAGAPMIQVLDAQMGFFGTAPTALPSVPAVPTAQNVVDALVALGLIEQLA